jgi:hypothetical protein
MALAIVRTGHWLYSGTVEKPVDIVGLDYDWHFESDQGAFGAENGEQPMPLDDRGLIYYVRFRKAGDTDEPTWVDTVGHATPEHAMLTAESKIPTGIVWD